MTACLSCKRSSPHETWYHFPPPDKDDEAVKEGSESITA
jgi:hypothetical protein